MSETQQTDTTGGTSPAPETEPANVYLFYEDVETNPGPGAFVMHGVNLYFRRGEATGPVTATIASVVTGRKKTPAIRIATDAEKPAVAESTAMQADVVTKDDDSAKTGDAPTTKGTTGPADSDPNAKPQTERRPKEGSSLTTG